MRSSESKAWWGEQGLMKRGPMLPALLGEASIKGKGQGNWALAPPPSSGSCWQGPYAEQWKYSRGRTGSDEEGGLCCQRYWGKEGAEGGASIMGLAPFS